MIGFKWWLVKHPEEGQMFDLSKDVNKELGIDNEDVKYFCFKVMVIRFTKTND